MSKLLEYVERVERLTEEKAEISEAIKEVLEEVKSEGFDIKAFQRMLTLRRLEKDALESQTTIASLYFNEVGSK